MIGPFLICLLTTLLPITPETLRDLAALGDHAFVAKAAKQDRLAHANEEMFQIEIEALSHLGRDRAMLEAYHDMEAQWPKKCVDHALAETLAWGVLKACAKHSSPLIQGTTLWAAAHAQDIAGVAMVSEALQSPHASLRSLSIDLSIKLRDQKLQHILEKRFSQEKTLEPKLALIRAYGLLNMQQMRPDMLSCLEDPSLPVEATPLVLAALLEIEDYPNPTTTTTTTTTTPATLLESSRLGENLLGLQILIKTPQPLPLATFTPLLHHPSSSVRLLTLYTLGRIRNHIDPHLIQEQIAPSASDPNALVRLMCFWVDTLCGDTFPHHAWIAWTQHPQMLVRCLATSLLGTLGSYGEPALCEVLTQARDPYVRANAAFRCLMLQTQIATSCHTLSQILEHAQSPHLVTWGVIPLLVPAQALDFVPPQSALETQLHILSWISWNQPELAKQALTHLLSSRTFVISHQTMPLLISEHDHSMTELLKELLDTPNFPHPTLALFLLALWTHSPDTLQKLQDLYPHTTRKNQQHILEILGTFPPEQALPFLVEKLQEPYPTLKILAASSILQSINHS